MPLSRGAAWLCLGRCRRRRLGFFRSVPRMFTRGEPLTCQKDYLVLQLCELLVTDLENGHNSFMGPCRLNRRQREGLQFCTLEETSTFRLLAGYMLVYCLRTCCGLLVDAQGLLLILATPAEATQRLGRVTESGSTLLSRGVMRRGILFCATVSRNATAANDVWSDPPGQQRVLSVMSVKVEMCVVPCVCSAVTRLDLAGFHSVPGTYQLL